MILYGKRSAIAQESQMLTHTERFVNKVSFYFQSRVKIR